MIDQKNLEEINYDFVTDLATIPLSKSSWLLDYAISHPFTLPAKLLVSKKPFFIYEEG